MPTIQSAGPDAATLYRPEHPIAVQVFDRDEYGNPSPVPKAELGTWPAWQVRALAELIAHPVDPGTILRRAGYEYEPRAAALSEAACMLLEDAEGCRHTRWTGKAPHRLGGRFFHTRTEGRPAVDGYLSMQDRTVLSLLAESIIALAGAEVPAKHVTRIKELVETCVHWSTVGASCYPSIPPAAEVALAAQGYTAAELLLDMAAAHVLSIAHYFESVAGPQRGAFMDAARQAKLYALPARKVIAQGVRHTLDGDLVEFEQAEGAGDSGQ
jgi:hypothetical protein